MAVEIKEEIDTVWGDVIFIIEDPEVKKITYEVSKPDRQFGLFAIKPRRGPVPPDLQGRWTDPSKAIKQVVKFLEKERKNANQSRTKAESNIQ